MDLLDYIIKYMNNKVRVASNLFDDIYGLSELRADGNEKAYVHYIGNGQGKPVTDFDKSNGTLFWIKRGGVSITPDAPAQLQDASCSSYVTINYGLRAICVVKKSHLPCDNATAVDQVAQELLHKLGGKDKTLRAALSASFCTINPTGYDTQVSGLPKNYEYASFALDYTIQVVLKQSCIPALCEDVPLPSCEFSVALRNTEGLLIYTVNQGSSNPFTLAVQEVVDGNGNTVEVPYDPNTPYVTTACTITCDAATVNVNGSLFNTVASGGTIDVLVEYENGTPTGTIVGDTVVIPNPITCEDATAVLKNTTGTTISSTDIPAGDSADITAPDATAVLKDTAGNTLLTEAIPSNVSENIVAPDGDVTVNGAAFDSVLSGGTLDVPVEYENGTPVGTITSGVVVIPNPVVCENDVFINVLFDSGATLDYTITIDANTAGTYTAASFSGGMSSATYEVNGTPDTLPFTLVATDTLQILPDAEGSIQLTGTY